MSVGLGKLGVSERKDTLCAKTTLVADTISEIALILVYSVGRKTSHSLRGCAETAHPAG